MERGFLEDFLARPDVSPEVYEALRRVRERGLTGEEASAKIWSATRSLHPPPPLPQLRDAIVGALPFPPDAYRDVKLALRELEAGLAEHAAQPKIRLILRARADALREAIARHPPLPAPLAEPAMAIMARLEASG